MKKEGKWYILFIIGIIFFSYLGSAAVCSAPNQTILTLYSSSNSHATVFNNTFNDASATYPLCYNSIFNKNWTLNNDPWICNGINKIVGLSSSQNAHVENPANINYGINICFGNLSCTLRSSNCLGSELLVISLSDNGNAHVAVDNSYPNKLCCIDIAETPIVTGDIGRVEWRDYGSNKIAHANVNDSVVLYAESQNPTDNYGVNLTIYKKNFILGLYVSSSPVKTVESRFVNGRLGSIWQIDDAFMNGGEKTFYFRVERSGNYNQSEDLVVINTESCTSNLDIDIDFNELCPQMVNMNIGISYRLNGIVSEGKELSNYWTVSNEFGVEESSNQLNFTYHPTSTGYKIIHLTSRNKCGVITDREKGLLVIGTGVFVNPFINAPLFGQVFPRTALAFRNIVYNATGSYAIRVGGTPQVITCLAGDCPSSDQCIYGADPSTIHQGYSNLLFNWTKIEKDSVNIIQQMMRGFGNVSGISSIVASKNNNLNGKSFLMNLNYSSILGESTKASRTVNFTLGYCIDGGRNWLRINTNGIVIGKVSTLSSGGFFFDPNACAGDDGNASNTLDNCCPNNMQCVSGEGCKPISVVSNCADTENPQCCKNNAFDCNSVQSELGNPCGEITPIVSCEWIGGLTGCRAVVNTYYPNGTLVNTAKVGAYNLSSCNKEAGFWLVNKTNICSDPGVSTVCGISCGQSEVLQLPCGKPAYQLPVFSGIQILVALILASVVYLISRKKKANKHIFKLR